MNTDGIEPQQQQQQQQPKIAIGYITELPCRKRNTMKRHIKVIYKEKVWEVVEFLARRRWGPNLLPYIHPKRYLCVDEIEYHYKEKSKIDYYAQIIQDQVILS